MVYGAGHQEEIGMFGITHIDNAETLDVVHRGQARKDLDVTAIATAAVKVQQPRGLDPGFRDEYL